jgi:hypothetical protein
MNNMKYPKYNGKQLDELSKARFDTLRTLIQWAIEKADDNNLTKKQIDVLSHNIAYTILTDL